MRSPASAFHPAGTLISAMMLFGLALSAYGGFVFWELRHPAEYSQETFTSFASFPAPVTAPESDLKIEKLAPPPPSRLQALPILPAFALLSPILHAAPDDPRVNQIESAWREAGLATARIRTASLTRHPAGVAYYFPADRAGALKLAASLFTGGAEPQLTRISGPLPGPGTVDIFLP